MDFLADIDWAKIITCTIILGLAFFIYLYKKRGKEFTRELCFDCHTYGRNDECMICGEKKEPEKKDGEL